MSDGMSDGHRWAEEHEARRKRVDAFFAAIERFFEKKMLLTDLKHLFKDFDDLRYVNHLISHQLKKSQEKRWLALQSVLSRVSALEGQAWVEILVLALQYASPNITKRLQRLAGLEAIALCASNGAHRPPTIYGDLNAVLDALDGGRTPVTARISDPVRAIVRVEMPSGIVVSEPEQDLLRFIGAFDPNRPKF